MNLNLSLILVFLSMIAAVASPSPDRGSITDGLTMIHDIQGDGLSSPLEGKEVLIEAIVTGIFQGSDKLEGFFVQEEDCDIDDNILTSEGLFIYDPGRLGEKEGISIGDTVLARGDIEEYHGLTQMRLKEIKKSDRGEKEGALTAHELILPLAQDSARLCPEMERYEGMLLMLPQDLVITDIGNLSRYGELSLSPRFRLPIPTNVAQPGAPAAGIQELNRRSIIILDDGSGRRYPESHPFPKTVRCGDTIRGITGIMSYSYGNYKIEPLNISEIIISNPRPESPEPVGGRLRIASLNLENYFNGDGLGGGFPAARGARSKSEFQLQRAKILQAIADMKVDVIGLIEIENDGYGSSSAISDLNDGLNALDDGAGMQNYEFIDPGLPKLGGDLISVGFIYNRTKIRPTGRAATTPRGASLSGNRQPLAQTFEEISSQERFTLAVIHLKSKKPTREGVRAEGDNADRGDGQGYWSADRTEAANELIRWLSSDPTGSHDPDYLILGDMNSYRNEDPIKAFRNAGYVDLIASRLPAESYSYAYEGQWGELDHLLASPSLAEQVTGATIWHINADEPPERGYSGIWSSPDKYRCSDHDPLIAGISLGNSSL